MKWSNIRLIFLREARDQLRDRRTLFTIAVLPLLLYPLLGMIFFQISQFLQEHAAAVLVIGVDALPEEPCLLEGEAFAAEFISPRDTDRVALEVRPSDSPEFPGGDAHRYAQQQVESGERDVVVLFPQDFGDKLAEFRHQLAANGNGRTTSEPMVVPQPEIFVNTASDKSRLALDRVERVLSRWREAIVQDNLRQRNVPVAATEPFEVVSTDVARERSRRAAMWSKVLPFVVFIWALTGAFYPAVDLCAGEKERGTLETLLCSPAQRGEIVWGKLLTIMVFSMATSVLNLLSMGLTGIFLISRLSQMSGAEAAAGLGMPPWSAAAWLLLALLPIAALFSALALAVAAFARSSKEGQYYLMPLLLVTLPLMLLPLLPTAELGLGTALIPVTGVMLLLRALIEDQYLEALRYAIPVIGVTVLCCLAAIRWAVGQFSNESVLFRESERWGLGLWLKHMVRDRGDTPSVGEAVMCGVLILLIRFFAGFAMDVPDSWAQFATTTAVTLVAFVAAPALLMTVMLTRRPAQTLLLHMPRPAALPMAVLLAFAIHPTGLAVAAAVQGVYPLNPEVEQQLTGISSLITQSSSVWSVLAVLALVPALCEELAFRGFILSGLRHTGHKWAAIMISSVLFGMAHGVLQQSLTAFVLGLVIGYLAVQTGSLLPAIIFHAVYNSLSLLMALKGDWWAAAFSWASWGSEALPESPTYPLPVVVASALLSAGLLLWFRNLPFEATAEEKLQDALVRGERLAEAESGRV